MAHPLEDLVARQYGVADLTARILVALDAAGIRGDHIAPEQLAPMDEFHIGGRPATMHAIAKMGLKGTDHVLDVGCGIGGATRYLASALGCRVTGLDLTPEYIAAAEELTRKTRLADRIAYRAGSALAMSFADDAFDAALTLHAAMNIEDRPGLYRQVARVLRPGAVFCIYDVMKGNEDGLRFPVAWAESAATSHLTTPPQTQALLTEAGFTVEEVEDRTDFALGVFRKSLAAPSAPAAGLPPLLAIALGAAAARARFQNTLANLEAGAIAPTLMLARKRA